MAEQATGLARASRVRITRGKYAGRHGLVKRASLDPPGFWWVELYNGQGKLGQELLFSVGQLLVRKAGQEDG